MTTGRNERETPPNERGYLARRSRRAVALGAGAAASLGVIALLLVVSPLAAATAVASFSAPYTGGTAYQYRDPVSQGCGQTLTVKVPATFVLSSGKATGQASAKASPCSTADSQASYDGTMGVKGLSFAAKSGATVTVKAAWTVTWNVSASMTSQAAAAGAQSTVEIYLILQITDTTAKKSTSAATVFVVQKDLSSATSYAAYGVSKSYASVLSGYALTGGHTYSIYAALAFSVQAVVPQGSPSGSVTTAYVDLASGSHGGLLASVSVA